MERIDPYRAAWVLIREYGQEAENIATKRILALLGQGDTDGAIACKRVLEIVGELRRTAPNVGEQTH